VGWGGGCACVSVYQAAGVLLARQCGCVKVKPDAALNEHLLAQLDPALCAPQQRPTAHNSPTTLSYMEPRPVELQRIS
jgi:hypothetical protein